MSRPGQGRRVVPPGWDVIIDPEDELRHRVFNVTDEQLHAFVRAVVTHGVEDFRVVRRPNPGDYDGGALSGPRGEGGGGREAGAGADARSAGPPAIDVPQRVVAEHRARLGAVRRRELLDPRLDLPALGRVALPAAA